MFQYKTGIWILHYMFHFSWHVIKRAQVIARPVSTGSPVHSGTLYKHDICDNFALMIVHYTGTYSGPSHKGHSREDSVPSLERTQILGSKSHEYM